MTPRQVIEHYGPTITAAASALGLSRQTIHPPPLPKVILILLSQYLPWQHPIALAARLVLAAHLGLDNQYLQNCRESQQTLLEKRGKSDKT